MVKINGKPLLEHLVNKLNKAGITEIIVNIHKDYDKIFKYFGTRLLYLYEPVLLGEAGTEKMLENWLGDEYIVMNGDTLTNIDFNQINVGGYRRARFCQNYRYAGTTRVKKQEKCEYPHDTFDYNIDSIYFHFDIGTPSKLARARKYYAQHPT